MHSVCVLGAGKIGASVAKLLVRSGDYRVTVADKVADALGSLDTLQASGCLRTQCLDIHDAEALRNLLAEHQAVISACAFSENVAIAACALQAGVSYFDLTEDNECTEAIRALAEQSAPGQVFVPQCGLAPGFIGILAYSIFQQFDEVESLKLRVGALPEYPSNQMMYNLTWSTDGLINEYCNPCHAIKSWQRVDLQPLEGLENFSLDGVEYEAFNTSGGLGTLCETLDGEVRELNYKTVRYPGHQYLMDFLINGLRLGERRQLLRKIFENAVAVTKQDVVLVMVSATGKVGNQLTQITDSRKIYHDMIDGEHWGSIQITTAASMCAVVDLYFDGQLPRNGFVRQEQIALKFFLNNRFGQYYLPHQQRRGDV